LLIAAFRAAQHSNKSGDYPRRSWSNAQAGQLDERLDQTNSGRVSQNGYEEAPKQTGEIELELGLAKPSWQNCL